MNNLTSHDSLFASLFQGRTDAYGAEEGRAELAHGIEYMDRIREHLHGDRPMGVYPMRYTESEGWAVNWGCVDFDEGDEPSWIHANNLNLVLTSLNIGSWIERSRSKGYHVWVFSHDLVPAHVMRRALLGATQIAKAPLKEINPKAEGFWLPRVSESQPLEPDMAKIGNYVRLPYPNGYTDRRVMCHPRTGETYSMEDFVELACSTRTTHKELAAIVHLYNEPAKPKPKIVYTPSGNSGPALSRIGGLTYTIFQNGPLEGMDRSGTLWKLANHLYTDGLTCEEARELLYDADERWGKYINRGAEHELEKMLGRLWEDQ